MLEDGEVFDSSLLKATVNNFISSGKRNVVIDLLQLDYIYSDSINVLMALNKRISDVGGYLALMRPSPEVVQILQKAGIYNVLSIFDSDEVLLNASEELMSRSSGQSGLSEFDQLRSEIGSVFGDQSSDSSSYNQNIYQPSDQNDYLTNDDQLSDYNNINRGAPQYTPPRQPSAPRPTPPQGPYTKPAFPNQQHQFQSKQFTPPPPPISSPKPIVPPPVQSRNIDNVQKPPVRPFADQGRVNQSEYLPETQKLQAVPAPSNKQPKNTEPSTSLSFNDELDDVAPIINKSQSRIEKTHNLEIENNVFDIDSKKKSPILALSLVAILLLVIIAGVLFVYMNVSKKPRVESETAESVQKELPVTPSPSTPASNVQDLEDKRSVMEPKPAKTLSNEFQAENAISKVVEKPVKKERVTKKHSPNQEKIAEKKPEPKKNAVTINKVYINSVPSGALVAINGDQIGKTPLIWDKPVFGPLSIQLTKTGFKSTSKELEFTGGILKESITLEKDIPVPPPNVKKEEPKEEPEVQQPVKASEPVEEVEVAEPVRNTPPPPPPAATINGDASIFIASIPPVADVYLNGKLVGRTNVSEIKLPSGTITLRFVKGPKEATQEVTLQPGKNPSRLVRLP